MHGLRFPRSGSVVGLALATVAACAIPHNAIESSPDHATIADAIEQDASTDVLFDVSADARRDTPEQIDVVRIDTGDALPQADGLDVVTADQGGRDAIRTDGPDVIICPPPLVSCSGTCVSLANDPQHCGNCGNVCPAGNDCSSGSCVPPPPCLPGLELCNGTCVDVTTDPNNCLGCGNQCPPNASCSSAGCTCRAALALCPTGCVAIVSDVQNCGGCGNVCSGMNASWACVLGSCTIALCDPGSFDCDMSPSNGCECSTGCDGQSGRCR